MIAGLSYCHVTPQVEQLANIRIAKINSVADFDSFAKIWTRNNNPLYGRWDGIMSAD